MAALSPQKRYLINYLGLVIIGTLNNLVYVVILSAAQTLADSFDASSQFGNITWATNVTGLLCRFLAMRLASRTTFRLRVSIVLLLMTLGILMIAYSDEVSFAFCIAGVVVIGTACTFGESVMLGYTKLWKDTPEIVGGWSSGTGWAGVLGSAAYIGLANVRVRYVFLGNLPLVILYGIVYAFVIQRPRPGPGAAAATSSSHLLSSPTAGTAAPSSSSSSSSSSSPSSSAPAASKALLSEQYLVDEPGGASDKRANADVDADQGDSFLLADPTAAAASINAARGDGDGDGDGDGGGNESERGAARGPAGQGWRHGMRYLWRIVKRAHWLSLNMGLVYFFEYMASQGCANNAQRKADREDPHASWFMRNSYEVLQFCYQFGVLLSRSSLRFFRIRRVGVITILQGLNLALWLCQDAWHFLPLWVQFPHMVWVGLMGGLSYVSIFYIILEGDLFEPEDKEVAVNVAATYMNTGIILAGVATIVLDKTLFKNDS